MTGKVKVLIAVVLAVGSISTCAQASEVIKLKMAFQPYRLGASTTIASTFDIRATNGILPSPLVKFELEFPESLNFSTSNLGLAICRPSGLESGGVNACPADAQIGKGHALVTVPIGAEPVIEETEVTALMGPSHNEQPGVLIYADGHSPVLAEMLFEGELLEGNSAYGELLETNVPLVPSVPGDGDAVVTKMVLTIDPKELLYYRRVRGGSVGYHPRGLELPKTCPVGGFRFRLTMLFADGEEVQTTYRIPCPRSRSHRRRRARHSTAR
jgi:hypothetical protein